MDIQIFLLFLIVILLIIIILQRTKLVISKRETYGLTKNISKEREATADILTLSKDVITTSTRDDDFLPRFVEYALRTLKGNGGAILKCGSDGYFHGCAIAGTFPPLKDVTPQLEQQLMAHSKKHTELFKGLKVKFTALDIEDLCGEKGYAFFKNQCPIWFPAKFIKEAPRILLSPIKIGRKTLGCVIVTSKDDFDSYKLTEEDGQYLVRLAEIASLSLEVLKVFRERQEYEVNLQSAREEGMMQVSTGIIHNIGNAITVAKLSVLELQEKLRIKREERPETLILEEILPKIKENVDKGNGQQFLSSDELGSQYIDIMKDLLTHVNIKSEEAIKQLASLSSKLYHISEIIELQQRFVGELGTENMISLSSVVDSSIKIFEETFNKRGVKIKADVESNVPEVLIDPSMMTQVIMNLIKNAVEAMDSEAIPEKSYVLELALRNETIEAKDYAVISVKDNGPGIPSEIKDKIFAFGFSTKSKGNSRGYGLHSCKNTVEKYSGIISIETETGKGTTFKIAIPVKKTA